MVADHTLHAVGLNAGQVSFQQNVGDLLGLILVKAVALEGFYAEANQLLIINVMVLHIRSSLIIRPSSLQSRRQQAELRR